MALLTKDQILSASDMPTRDVEVPEWGGTVRVRSLTAAERDEFEASVAQAGPDGKSNLKNVRARLCMRALVDDAGSQMFSQGDIALLGRKSAKALDRVFDAARELSGMRKEDVEGLAKNSEAAPDDGSPSD